MWYVEDECKIKLGGNTYINVPNIIVYRGEPLFKISRSERSNLLGIDFDIFDKNGERIATVRRGRIVQGDEKN